MSKMRIWLAVTQAAAWALGLTSLALALAGHTVMWPAALLTLTLAASSCLLNK